MTNAKRRKLWAARVADYRASELPVRLWCEKNGVSDNQLRYWLGKIGPAASEPSAPEITAWTGVEILEDDAPKRCSSESLLAIHIGPARIEVRPGFDPALLSEVIRVVVASC